MDEMVKYKYIYITVISEKPKTKVYGIFNNKNDHFLGEIKWYFNWRQYCFFPVLDTVYSHNCLENIIDFIKNIKR
jgi:hypothetical protein